MKAKIITILPVTLLFTFIVWMIIQADMDQNNVIMDIGHSVPHGDKVGHFSLFGSLALFLNIALGFKRINIMKRTFHLGSIIVLLFAVGEEFTQLAFSSRNFDVIDMLFDLFGIGVLSSISFRKYVVEKLQSFTLYLSQHLLVE